MRILVTGWAGFIGSNLVRMILRDTAHEVIGLDCFTYAARPEWAREFLKTELKVDIRQITACDWAIGRAEPDAIIHLAAESHVCRSIEGPEKFMESNAVGTMNLLEAVRRYQTRTGRKVIFQHVSTDEVYGVAKEDLKFDESWAYSPRSPYAASKAASDHWVMAYHHTYGMDCRITNCSNNFGPNQHEEKLIPKAILHTLKGKEVTIYGPGTQVRDWIWVDDHCRGILAALHSGKPGSQYLFGGECELTNLEVMDKVWQAVDLISKEHDFNVPPKKFRMTNDRPTDDHRYAINCDKAKRELPWKPEPKQFMQNLVETVKWYMERM